MPEAGEVFDVLLAAEDRDAGVLFDLPDLPEWLRLGPIVISGDEGDVRCRRRRARYGHPAPPGPVC